MSPRTLWILGIALTLASCKGEPRPLRTSVRGLRPPAVEQVRWDSTRITGGEMLVVRGRADLKCWQPTVDVDMKGRVLLVEVRGEIADSPCSEEIWQTHYEAHVEGLPPGLWEVRVRAFDFPEAVKTVQIL